MRVRKNSWNFIFYGPNLLVWVTHGNFELEGWIWKLFIVKPRGNVHFHISGTANQLTFFVNESLIKYGPSSIGQYDVKRWRLEPHLLRQENTTTMVMTVELTRNFFNISWWHFCPLYWWTSSTNYCDNNFELVITVNITCMMVLAFACLSLSSSLPSLQPICTSIDLICKYVRIKIPFFNWKAD